MKKEPQAYQTPLHDLCRSALDHYEEVSTKAHHWLSIIPQAIKLYYAKQVMDYIILHPNDWEDFIKAEDLQMFYKNAPMEWTNRVSRFIDALD